MSRYLFIELAEVCVDLFRHDNHLCLQCVAVCCIVSPFCCSSFDKSFCQCRVTGGRFDAESIGLFYGSFFICVGLVWQIRCTSAHTVLECELEHTTTYCQTLEYAATYCGTLTYLPHTSAHTVLDRTLRYTATYSNILQHTALNCNILQHTATHWHTFLIPQHI